MKPILFNTEMVQAILEGRKSVTRRAIKLDLGMADTDKLDSSYLRIPDEYGEFHDAKDLCKYKVGDILYVRETFCELYKLDGNDQIIEGSEKYYYRADGENPTPYNHFPDEDGFNGFRDGPRWKPSIHMPKEAARIFLKVTDVRVERLKDINGQEHHDDILKEGLMFREDVSPVRLFKDLWNSTLKKADLDKYGWEANPWVWVISFERVEIVNEGI